MGFFSGITRERTTQKYLTGINHAHPRVWLLRDGSAFALFEIEGIAAQTLDTSVLFRHRASLNHILTGLAGWDNLVLYSWVCRGLAPDSVYPAGEFLSDYGAAFNDRYRARLTDKYLYLNRTYIGVMLRSPRLGGEWLGDKIVKARGPRDAADEVPEARIERLLRACDVIENSLEAYQPRALGIEERNGQRFTQIGEALCFAMTGVWRSVGMQQEGRIGPMFSERFITGPETIEIRGPGHPQSEVRGEPRQASWAACFGAKYRPEICLPGTLDGLLSGSFRCTVAQSWRLLDRQSSLDAMGDKQHRMKSAGDRALSQIEALDAAMDQVQSGRMAMGDHGMVVTAFADRYDSVPRVASDCWHILQDAGCQVAREEWALESAFWSKLPGNEQLRPRPGLISSWNFASLASMHAYPTGADTSSWGEPLLLLRTVGGTPFKFHLQSTVSTHPRTGRRHATGNANVFAFGRAGSGKSVGLASIIAQSERLGATCIVYDKDRGLEIVIRAVGGNYMAITNPTGLAPLRAYHNTNADIHALARLIRGQIGITDNYTLTAEEDRRLFLGLRAVMALPPAQRWYRDLRAFLGVGGNGAGARLEKWCWGNEYGWVSDCPVDMVNLSKRVNGFDVTTFLEDPMVCGPVMTDLLYRTGKLADGRKGITIVDEGWKVVNIPQFSAAAADELKTDRKKNWSFIFATQSISDARNSAIAHTIREQCPAVLGFGVERPDRDDFKWLGYSDRECDLIETLHQDTFLLSQGRMSAVLQLPLGSLRDDLAVFSGTTRNVEVLDKVRAKLGENVKPLLLIEAFHGEREA